MVPEAEFAKQITLSALRDALECARWKLVPLVVELAGTLFLTMRCVARGCVNPQQSTMQNNWVDAQAAGQLFLLQELIESL